MRVLIACERSGVVRRAFRAAGHNAWSCDLAPAEDGSRWHIEGDALRAAHKGWWDLMIAHPPCTYLSSSGMHWTTRGKRPWSLTEQALDFVRALMDVPVARICIENPVGVISTRIRRPDQWVQPHQFGDDASKRTGLWLQGLPLLVPTRSVAPRWVCPTCGEEHPQGAQPRFCRSCEGLRLLPRWANQTNSGQNRLPPGERRAIERSQTYPGIAAAMAEQWGGRNVS